MTVFARGLSENAEHIFGRFFGSFFLKKGTENKHPTATATKVTFNLTNPNPHERNLPFS
jgi:hypothetical protein